MTFRQPREEDYLGSHLRRHIFQNLPRQELTLDTIFGRANEDYDPEAQLLLTDDSNPLSGWQDEDALPHWQREFIDSNAISLSALNVYYISGPPAILTPSNFELTSETDVPLSTPPVLPLFLVWTF